MFVDITVQTNAVEKLLGDRDRQIKELELQLTTLESTSYDGTFIWRISDIARLRTEAAKGGTAALTSPAFYTSRTGNF